MKLEIPQLNRQIQIQKKINDGLEQSIILKDQTIGNYKRMDEINKNIIEGKDKEIRKANLSAKAWMIGGISVTVVATIIFIFK